MASCGTDGLPVAREDEDHRLLSLAASDRSRRKVLLVIVLLAIPLPAETAGVGEEDAGAKKTGGRWKSHFSTALRGFLKWRIGDLNP